MSQETINVGDAKDVPTGRIALALTYLDASWFAWRREGSMLIARTGIAAKAASLIAHDRIISGELALRGIPDYYYT